MAPIDALFQDHAPPAATLPVVDFFESEGESRERAVMWASGVIADICHHSDETILQAAKTLHANAPTRFSFAGELIKTMEKTDAL